MRRILFLLTLSDFLALTGTTVAQAEVTATCPPGEPFPKAIHRNPSSPQPAWRGAAAPHKNNRPPKSLGAHNIRRGNRNR